jgi:anti-sigma factor RsiW
MFLGERMRHDEREKCVMNCEEFEAMGLDIERDSAGSAAEQAAAREHASTCSRCAALQDSWMAAKLDLSALGEATRAAETPERVEMRLRQEFRTRHRSVPARRAVVIAAWALATAAVLVGGVSWRNWQKTYGEDAARHQLAARSTGTEVAIGSGQVGSGVERASSAASGQNHAQDNLSVTVMSADDAGEFTLLPGSVPADAEDAAIWRVQMQRATLSALGFPVNEDRAGEWIQVDLLVGNDGLPQGVRLAR